MSIHYSVEDRDVKEDQTISVIVRTVITDEDVIISRETIATFNSIIDGQAFRKHLATLEAKVYDMRKSWWYKFWHWCCEDYKNYYS